MPLLLQYDSTAEESDTIDSHGVGASVQIAKNMHAVRAAQALSRLSGLCIDRVSTPYNEAAAAALRALLTPKLASLLRDHIPKDLLSKLNSNLESPEVSFFFVDGKALTRSLFLKCLYRPSCLCSLLFCMYVL